MANLMGFTKVPKAPGRHGGSIYDELLSEVLKGGIYVRDTGDAKRANALAATIRAAVRKRGINVKVSVRDKTNVVLEKVRPSD